MRRCLTLVLMLSAGTALAADAPKANTLTAEEISEGRVLLFDGETTFGWKTEGDVTAKDGALILGGAKESTATTTCSLRDYRVDFQFLSEGKLALVFRDKEFGLSDARKPATWTDFGYIVRRNGDGQTVEDAKPKTNPRQVRRIKQFPDFAPMPVSFKVQAGAEVRLRNIKLTPVGLDPIFNGKDLAGWKRFTAEEKRAKSVFSVTPEGWINIKNGPGDLQTEKQWADFVFQGEGISNGKALNSGVFFRCIPDKYQQGYEYQIHNGFTDNDRAKPKDYGTGAIYNRIKARKVVPNDHEWFYMTLIAKGNHIATWVNGYQTVDWTDERKESDNARNGSKLGAGRISLQGHDPTTDLSFRNLRIAELKKE